MLRKIDIYFSHEIDRSLSIMFREQNFLVFSYPSKQVHATLITQLYPFALEMLSLEGRYIFYEVCYFPCEVYYLLREVCFPTHLSLMT